MNVSNIFLVFHIQKTTFFSLKVAHSLTSVLFSTNYTTQLKLKTLESVKGQFNLLRRS